jgi:hypothetical protein
MPRSLFGLALLAFVSLLAIAPPVARAAAAPAPSGELLANPGFESPLDEHPWMPADWDTSLTALPTVFFGRDTFLAHGGRWAVNVANTSTLVPTWHNWNQAIVVGPEVWGKDLVLSVWTRSNGLQGRAYIMLQAYRDTIGKMAKTWGLPRDPAGKRLGINKLDDPILNLGWQRRYFSDPETDWVRREVRVFVPPTVNMVYVRCGLVGTGQVIFDDASLRAEPARPAPVAAIGANLFADPGFEGDGNEWEYSLPPYAGQRIDRDTAVVHSGRASVRYSSGIEGLIQARAGACQVLGREVAGQHVRLSAWVKTDSLKLGGAYLRLYSNSPTRGVLQSDPGDNLSLTHDWTRLAVELDVPEDAAVTWAWLAYTAPATGLVWYDDAALEVLGPARGAAAPATKPAPLPQRPAR